MRLEAVISDGPRTHTVRLDNCTQVVIYNDYDDPVVATVYSEPVIITTHAAEPDFQKTLASLGIHRPLICDQWSQPTPPGKLWTP